MDAESSIIAQKQIAARILTLRGEKVMLDADLAELYAVPTKVLNQAVKRNESRFPADFLLQLTEAEKLQVVTNCDHLKRLKYSPVLPWAFTEHGALMAANILNSPRAAEMSVYVIRAFVQMRRELSQHEGLGRRLAEIERTLLSHGMALRDLYQKIRPLLLPPPVPKPREIGFHAKPGDEAQPKGRKK
jgi:hypothetical protein